MTANIAQNPPPQPVLGTLSIIKGSSGKVGTDTHYSFGKTITIENGKKFLKVDPNDLIYFCELDSNFNDKTIQVELPSSLFEQARQADTVYFAQNGTRYELKLTPHIRSNGLRYVETSFDDCVRGVKENFKSSACEFLYHEDIPDDYYPFAHQNGFNYFLSSKAKQIALDVKGTFPINFDELSVFPIHCTPQSREERHENSRHEIDAYFFRIFAPGRPKIDIFLDRNWLYCLADISFPPKKGMSTCNDTMIGKTHLFFHAIIETHGKNIDESNLIASLNNEGELQIAVPLSDSIAEVNQTSLDVKHAPVKTRILARCDVGSRNKLFVRGDGAPSLNWEKGIEMRCIEGPDLWVAEFDQLDSAHLQFKFLLNDLRWEKGNNHEIAPGKTQEITPSF